MRMTSSKSSPMLSASSPPTSTRTSRRNMPKAPLMRMSAPKRDQPVRPSMKARRYSTTWIRASRDPGMRIWTMRPSMTRAAVGRADGPAGGHRADRVVGERLGDAEQRVGVEDRVGVDHGHQRLGGGVDAHVDGVGAPGVLLAHQHQPGPTAARHQDLGDRGARRHVGGQLALDRDEVEGGPQPVARAVGAAVVDDHHLVAGVAQGEHGLHRGDDAGLLVVRRDDDRHPRRELARDRLVVPGVLGPPPVVDEVPRGEPDEQQVGGVDDEEVDEHRDLDGGHHRLDEGAQGVHATGPQAGHQRARRQQLAAQPRHVQGATGHRARRTGRPGTAQQHLGAGRADPHQRLGAELGEAAVRLVEQRGQGRHRARVPELAQRADTGPAQGRRAGGRRTADERGDVLGATEAAQRHRGPGPDLR